jgi:hypothetical protein
MASFGQLVTERSEDNPTDVTSDSLRVTTFLTSPELGERAAGAERRLQNSAAAVDENAIHA